jgi:hypothetical protein
MNARPISDRIIDLANRGYYDRNFSIGELNQACLLQRHRRAQARTLIAIGFLAPLIVGIVVAAFA